jgi:hypothetical protein
MSLLNQINKLSFKERYQILCALGIKVVSNKNDKPEILEKFPKKYV